MFDFLLTNHGFINIFLVFFAYPILVALSFIVIRQHNREQGKAIIDDASLYLHSFFCLCMYVFSIFPEEIHRNFLAHAYITEVTPVWAWLFSPFYAALAISLTYICISKIKVIIKAPKTSLKTPALIAVFSYLILNYSLFILVFLGMSSPGANIAVKYPNLVSNQTVEAIQECDQASLFPSSSVAKEKQNIQLIINADACDKTDEKGKLAGEKAHSVVSDRLNALKRSLHRDEEEKRKLDETKNKLEHLIQQSNQHD